MGTSSYIGHSRLLINRYVGSAERSKFLILVAVDDERVVGYKIGYQSRPKEQILQLVGGRVSRVSWARSCIGIDVQTARVVQGTGIRSCANPNQEQVAKYAYLEPPVGECRTDSMASEMAVQYRNGRRIVFLCRNMFDTFNRCIVPNIGEGG